MLKVVIVSAAAVIGSAALSVAGLAQSSGLVFAEAAQTGADVKVKACLGPGRILFGGEPFVNVRFGGEGCGETEHVVGLELVAGS